MNIFMKNLKFKSVICIISILSFFVFLETSVNAAAPTVVQPIPNQVAHNGESFEMSFLKYGIFADSDGDNLSIEVKQSDDSPLPSWLSVSAKPLSPSIVGTCDTPGSAQGIAVAGNYAYVGDYTSGLQIIDISNSTNPNIVGTCDTPGYAYGVALDGNYAYVADYNSGLQIIDISNPTNSSIAGTYYTTDLVTTSVAVKGNNVYVADSAFGLRVIDVSNPSSPSSIGTLPIPGGIHGIIVVGNYAYASNGGLYIIDVTIPTNPTRKGTCDTPGAGGSAVVVGGYAYVSDGSDGLQIINISDPDSPDIVTAYDTPGGAMGVTVVGDYAYVTDCTFGLQIIDISIPSSPNLVGAIDTSDCANKATVVGNYAYVTDGSDGLKIVDDVGGGTLLSGTSGFFDLGTLNLKAIASDVTAAEPTSVPTLFSINVLESTTNNKPTVTAQKYKKSQNTSLRFNKEQFVAAFHDDDSDELSKIQITSLPNHGELKLSGIAVSLNQEIDVDDIDDLSFVPEKDWTGTATFEWRGFDGITYSDEGVVTIKVSAADPDWLEKWWPVVTGTTLAAVGVVTTVTATVVGAVLAKKAKKCKCCFKGEEEDIDLEDLKITLKKDEK